MIAVAPAAVSPVRLSRIAWAMLKAPSGNRVNRANRPMAMTKMATSTSINVTPLRDADFMFGAPCSSDQGIGRHWRPCHGIRLYRTGADKDRDNCRLTNHWIGVQDIGGVTHPQVQRV